MSRTQRLEAALRGLLEVCACDNGCAPDDMTCATNAARAALADTSPSCCEEVRRATLEDATKVADGYRDAAAGAEGEALRQKFRTADAIAKTIRALSNQAPPKSQTESNAHLPPRSAERIAWNRERRHCHQCLISPIEEDRRDWASPMCHACMPDSAPPVCPTCGGSQTVRSTLTKWEPGPCPDCGGGK